MNANYLKELQSGYFDENSALKLDLIIKYPSLIAKDFSSNKPVLATKQARGFFNVCNKLYLNVVSGRMSIAEAKSELAMTQTRIYEKVKKDILPQDFFDFFENNIKQIETDKDFKAFILHFEAVYNYLKDTKTTNGNNNIKRDNTNNRYSQNNTRTINYRK